MENMQNNGVVQDGSSVAEEKASVAEKTAMQDGERRGMAAISYLGVFCVIPLFFAKDSAFAQYHAKQGMILAIAGMLLRAFYGFLWDVPFGGALVSLVGLAIFVASVMGIVKALQGEKFEIPYVSEWAKKFQF
ncbi:MAG: hypothetical protein WCT28_01420 [Patescibacteria group bacterium]